MSPEQEIITWQHLREFRGLDLQASFVLSWGLTADELQLEIDAVLVEEHPLYERPRPSQKHCMRAATIEFPYVDQIVVQEKAVDRAAASAELSKLQPGLLTSLVVKDEGHYVLAGEFGTVAFEAERPVLRILSH